MTTTPTDGAMGLTDLVAEEIRAMMARKRVTGRGLARELDVSDAWISYRLSGKQPIDLHDLERIADALGVDVHDLLPSRAALAEERERPDPGHLGRRPTIRSSSWLRSGVLAARNAITRPPRRSDLVRPGGDAWPNAA